jgi:hypothetical protein
MRHGIGSGERPGFLCFLRRIQVNLFRRHCHSLFFRGNDAIMTTVCRECRPPSPGIGMEVFRP